MVGVVLSRREEELNSSEYDEVVDRLSKLTLTEDCEKICQDYKHHFKVIRLVAILLMLYAGVTLIGVFAVINVHASVKLTDANPTAGDLTSNNVTECVDVHTFPLSDELYVSACWDNAEVKIKIKQYEESSQKESRL